MEPSRPSETLWTRKVPLVVSKIPMASTLVGQKHAVTLHGSTKELVRPSYLVRDVVALELHCGRVQYPDAISHVRAEVNTVSLHGNTPKLFVNRDASRDVMGVELFSHRVADSDAASE